MTDQRIGTYVFPQFSKYTLLQLKSISPWLFSSFYCDFHFCSHLFIGAISIKFNKNIFNSMCLCSVPYSFLFNSVTITGCHTEDPGVMYAVWTCAHKLPRKHWGPEAHWFYCSLCAWVSRPHSDLVFSRFLIPETSLICFCCILCRGTSEKIMKILWFFKCSFFLVLPSKIIEDYYCYLGGPSVRKLLYVSCAVFSCGCPFH